MTFASCAEIVQKSDPDRFLATMSVPTKFRGPLFALYAFNVEVSRAPWVSSEPTINQMRLQWWRDVLQEIAVGKQVRRHEVATPLATIIDGHSVAVLTDLIEARQWDIYSDPFDSSTEFDSYLQATAGGLMWVAARATGAETGEPAAREFGYCSGLANWFRAVPGLLARGRMPLLDDSDGALVKLAQDGLVRLNAAQNALPAKARTAAYAGWQTSSILSAVAANPATVIGGRLHKSEFSRRSSLLWRVMRGRP